MNDQETDYLNKLFSLPGEKAAETLDADEQAIPMLDVPAGLSEKLYAITEHEQHGSDVNKARFAGWWPKLSAVAASLLLAVVMVQLYQQQQTLKQLEQAQSDLAVALQYLGEANRITKAQMLNTLNSNMQKAAFRPVIEAGRNAVEPTLESLETLEPKPRTLNRAL